MLHFTASQDKIKNIVRGTHHHNDINQTWATFTNHSQHRTYRDGQRGRLSIRYHCLWSTMMSLQTPPSLFLSSVSAFWDAVLEADLLLDQGLWCKTEQLYETPGFYLRKRCLFVTWSRYFILATVIIIRVSYFTVSRSSNVV